jgi:hypothetical protein
MNELYRRIDGLLEQRARDFPRRVEPLFSELLASIRELAAELRKAAGDVAPEAPPADFASRPVFVVGYFRSGTSLLQSLLAGHGEVLMLPGEANWFAGERTERLPEVHTQWIRRIVSPDGLPPFWMLGRPWEGGEDLYARFTRKLLAYAAGEPNRDLLGAVAAAYAACQSRPTRVWAEKTPGNEWRLDEILAVYPHARFVHIVRDPRATLASIVAFNRARPAFPPMQEAAAELARSLAAATSNADRLGDDRYLMVRYEDLVTDPERETRRIAGFVGIEWDEALLAPSLVANSSTVERRTPGRIHRLSVDRGAELGVVADAVVRAFAAEPARALGYDVPRGNAAVGLAARASLKLGANARALVRGLRRSRST